MDYRTRAQWGATFDVSKLSVIPLPRNLIFVHHNVIPPTNDPNYDMERTEQADIARFGKPSYKWAVHPSGVVLEGMTLHHSPDTFAHNDDISIMFMGNFEVDTPTDAAMLAGRELVARIHSFGWVTDSCRIMGHRDVYSTACPGRNLYPRIQELAVPPQQEDDMVTAMYMRPKDSPGVGLVFDSGAIIPVANYANIEEVWVHEMGVVIKTYSTTEDNTDTAGNTRKVWVTDDPGISKAIKQITN